MSFGYVGKIAHVNLTTRSIEYEEPNEVFYRTYMGGRNLAAYYLLKKLPPNTDPYSPQNVLVFAISVVTGAPFAGSGRHTLASKSPLTGAYGESEAGGFWGPELKFAGYDAIVVTGKADKPVYLWVTNDNIEIRDAGHIWGKSTADTDDLIREESGDPRTRVVCIGQGGENLVRFAAAFTDAKHANGRTGMGAVMGSKNLKAVAVRGKGSVKMAKPEIVMERAKWFAQNYMQNGVNSSLNNIGTPAGVLALNAIGKLPTENFSKGQFTGANEISGEKMKESMYKGQEGCFACPVKCKHQIEINEGTIKVSPRYGAIEYESIAALGSNCGIADAKIVLKANELCNSYGIDTISTGDVIAFAMECAVKGILTEPAGIVDELKFGNGTILLNLIEDIAFRKGIGNQLAEGVKRFSEQLGDESKKFAMHVKGEEIALHEPRGKWGVGLGYAVSPIGGDHLQAEHDDCFVSNSPFLDHLQPLGILEPVPSMDLSVKKVRLFTYLQMIWSLTNVLDLCNFVNAPEGAFTLKDLELIVSGVTGWNTSLWELMKTGERGLNLARCFNLREGFTRKDDWLPERFFEPLPGGPLKGKAIAKKELAEAITCYYAMMGWDPETGVPTKAKLAELGIDWVFDSKS